MGAGSHPLPSGAFAPVSMVAERTSERPRQERRPTWTLESFYELPEETPEGWPVHHELWDGELLTHMAPGFRHGWLVANIATLLKSQGDWLDHGVTIGGDAGVVFSPEPPVTLFGPDVAFLTKDQLPLRVTEQDWLLTVPALVVEVRSKRDRGRHSLGRKIQRYLGYGVRVVWEVDPVAQAVLVHRQGAEPVRLGIEDELTAEGIIPSLRFPIRRLFAEPEAAR
jgi:Uma2 family endonuclease